MSAKTSAQPGRRTPLSLSGAVTKSQPNKGSSNIANGSGINANGHSAPTNSKQDNKLQQEKSDQASVSNIEAKENANKKQQLHAEKKIQQNESKKSNEKGQNGASDSNKMETNESKREEQNVGKTQHQNGNDDGKERKEKPAKAERSEKPKEKSEKDNAKSKEDPKREREQNIPQNKNDDKKTKQESNNIKEVKKEVEVRSKPDANTEIQQQIKDEENKPKDESKDKEKVKTIDKKSEEQVHIVVEDQIIKKSVPSTPKSNKKTIKTSTTANETPTKIGEKTPQKSAASNKVKITPHKREETTAIDDNDTEMEPLAVESSPAKIPQPEEVANIKIVPTATSTPGKVLLPKRNCGIPKSDVVLAMQTEHSPDRPKMFSQISGRKSIRPISDYTPSKFQSNLQFRESYRRINTELDVTNTSMNVTVGSEVPSNFSFSFFGRGRKRDRTPTSQQSQSAIGELQTDIETSPPKKARLDIHGLFSAVSSPMTLLRNRFSKASLQSSTPVKLQGKLYTDEDDIEVQNVSGVSVQEEITTPDEEPAETNLTVADNDATLGEEAKEAKLKANTASSSPIELNSEGREFKEISAEKAYGMEESCERSVAGDQMAKNKRCVVM